MSERRKKREFTDEFKKQVVDLFNNGKSRSEIIKEYDLTPSALAKWINQYNNSGSFKAADNRTAEENELIRLQKRNKQLEMEVDILKQAALIMGRK
jgi:transposase